MMIKNQLIVTTVKTNYMCKSLILCTLVVNMIVFNFWQNKMFIPHKYLYFLLNIFIYTITTAFCQCFFFHRQMCTWTAEVNKWKGKRGQQCTLIKGQTIAKITAMQCPGNFRKGHLLIKLFNNYEKIMKNVYQMIKNTVCKMLNTHMW